MNSGSLPDNDFLMGDIFPTLQGSIPKMPLLLLPRHIAVSSYCLHNLPHDNYNGCGKMLLPEIYSFYIYIVRFTYTVEPFYSRMYILQRCLFQSVLN